MERKGTRRAKPTAAAVLRGSALATVDDAGRLKLPATLRRSIEHSWGRALYLTSLLGDSLWVYPLPVWEARERRILALVRRHPVVERFIARTSYFGAEVELDSQGRLVVPPLVRAAARLEGEVAVLGALDHLEVWNNALFKARLEAEPITPEDRLALSELEL